jgi:ribosomal protection tetracycline resistance protein
MLNLGILAHVDAGKTSLTERLLYAAGVIDEIGSVDDGSTQTDTLALERQRGITIKAAVTSFTIAGDTTVNLIDTPGHPDFIAEVERSLSVLDGAVLVISAVEGVQAQTHVLMRALKRLAIPTLIFVNKIDRRHADDKKVLAAIANRLTPAVIPMGSVREIGTARAAFVPASPPIDVLADHDDDLLAEYLADGTLPPGRVTGALAEQTARALVHPVFFGSAITGAGVDELTEGIARLLPGAPADTEAAASGSVFKVERGPAGEKIAYVRMFAGRLRLREKTQAGRVTSIDIFGQQASRAAGQQAGQQASQPAGEITAGQIGRLWGLNGVRIGDTLGAEPPRATRHRFAPPTLETVVSPVRSRDNGRLHAALSELAEQDPLIDLRVDDEGILVSLYGEVQKEVLDATLRADFGLAVTFRESTVICVERPVGTGAAVDFIKAEGNPFLATVGLRIEPASGFGFRLGIELGALPLAFIKAIEDTVRATLTQGLHGWRVIDCAVTLTHSGYWPRQSAMHAGFDKSISTTASDFRGLVPLILMEALSQAGTRVYEPVQRFHLSLPARAVPAALPVLIRAGGLPEAQQVTGDTCVVDGTIPAASVHGLERQLPGLTSGEGVLDCVFDHYERVRGAVPSRPRSGPDPLDRKEYLLRVTRGV